MLHLRKDKRIVQRRGFAVVAHGRLKLAQDEVHLAAVIVNVRVVRVERHGTVKVGHGRVLVAQLDVHARLLDPGLHVLWTQLYTAVQVLQRTLGFAHHKHVRAVHVEGGRFELLGRQSLLQCLLEERQRVCVVLRLQSLKRALQRLVALRCVITNAGRWLGAESIQVRLHKRRARQTRLTLAQNHLGLA